MPGGKPSASKAARPGATARASQHKRSKDGGTNGGTSPEFLPMLIGNRESRTADRKAHSPDSKASKSAAPSQHAACSASKPRHRQSPSKAPPSPLATFHPQGKAQAYPAPRKPAAARYSSREENRHPCPGTQASKASQPSPDRTPGIHTPGIPSPARLWGQAGSLDQNNSPQIRGTRLDSPYS